MSSWRTVAVDAWERWRKVDCSVGDGFDDTNILARSTTCDVVQRQFELDAIDVTL